MPDWDERKQRLANLRKRSLTAPVSLMEVAVADGSYPYTDKDLTRLKRICANWGIRTNVDKEPWWMKLAARQVEW